ncbi:MAG: hypothetical protein RSA10_03780 [Bacilli bacterium]
MVRVISYENVIGNALLDCEGNFISINDIEKYSREVFENLEGNYTTDFTNGKIFDFCNSFPFFAKIDKTNLGVIKRENINETLKKLFKIGLSVEVIRAFAKASKSNTVKSNESVKKLKRFS